MNSVREPDRTMKGRPPVLQSRCFGPCCGKDRWYWNLTNGHDWRWDSTGGVGNSLPCE